MKALQSDPVVLEIIGTPPRSRKVRRRLRHHRRCLLPAAKVSDEGIDGALSGGLSGGLARGGSGASPGRDGEGEGEGRPKPVAKAKPTPSPTPSPTRPSGRR